MRIRRYVYHPIVAIAIGMTLICGPAAGRDSETGRYPVFNFSPKEYDALEQNWCAIQDSRGIMYFGNNHGVLEYDGVNWTLIPPSTSSPVKSITRDADGRIYFGSIGEFGYLIPDSIGRLDYHLISEQLGEGYEDFNVIWETHVTDDGIIFQAYHYIFIWKDGELEVIPSEDEIHESFYAGGHLFLTFNDSRIGYLSENSILMIPENNIPKTSSIYGMVEREPGNILIVTDLNGFYAMKFPQGDPAQAVVEKIRTHNDRFFSSIDIFNVVRVNPGRISLGTWGNGAVIIDSSFTILAVIDKNAGLQDQIIQGQYVDRSGNLWLALSSGISRVEIQNPLTHFGDGDGLLGTIQSITRFNDRIYATTNVGLFYMDHEYYNPEISRFKYSVFKPVEGVDIECWDMITFRNGSDEVLLFATNTSVLELTKDHKKNELLEDYVYSIYQSKLDPRRVYIGLESGLTSIYRTNGRWEQEDKIAEVDEMITNLSEDHVGNLWMGTNEEGILRLHIQRFEGNRIGEYTISRYHEDYGLPRGPFIISQFRGPPSIATNKGLFKYNQMDESFRPDSSYGDQFGDGSLYIHRISEYSEPEIWMVTFDENAEEFKYQVGYLKEEAPGEYTWVSEPFNQLSEELIHSIYQESDGIVWLGGSQGLFHYDMNAPEEYTKDYNAYVRRVELSSGELLFGGSFQDKQNIQSLIQQISFKPVLPYKENSLIFQYSAQPGEDESFTRYSYFLDGNDKSWSGWIPEPKKEYTNLREGKYVFRVRSRNIYGQISNEATYEFSILAPWYRKWWAYFLYVLAAGFIIYTIVKVYTRHLRQIIRDRTAEVVAQKEVIEEKNKDIMDSIQYAKKIQRALLPAEDNLGIMDLDGFVLFLPRDVVSGDFYWLTKQNGKIVTVAADCTGHGVPGAFMSMLGVAFLNNIVEVKGITKAADILNELRSDVIAALKQKGQEGEQKDGMDVALHVIDYEKMTIEFAGANNSLIIIRDNKIQQVRADRMPIGIHERARESFHNHRMKAVKGDVLYTFSDGYQDQFGGPKNKKFMAKRLKDLLLEIHRKPMAEQKKILEKTFFDWIRPYNVKQVDDVIVIGIRI